MGYVQKKFRTAAGVKTRVTAAAVVLAGALFLGGCAGKKSGDTLESTASHTAEYVLEQTPAPGVASVGGEWAVLGLKTGGYEVKEQYYDSYYDTVRAAVKAKKGTLSDTHYTEYARVSIALCAIGKDPGQVEGYNLVEPLDNYEMIDQQGMNAAAFALVASNVSGIPLEQEEAYIQLIIDVLEEDQMFENKDAADYVAIALEGLSFYQSDAQVEAVLEEGVQALSEYQEEDGSYGNCETTAECIMALSQLGIDVQTDERFIKNGNTMYDGLMVYQMKDGGFCHVTERKKADAMASEKALLAMDSLILLKDHQTLYKGVL